MTVLIFKNFINEEICNELNNWVLLGVKNKWLDVGQTCWKSEKRKTTRMYGDRFNYPNIAYTVFENITKKLELHDLKKSVAGGGKDGIVVNYTPNGGDTFEHLDRKEGEFEVLRCNILTSKPTNGGELFVDGKEIKINVGDLHCYLPSVVRHNVLETKGNIPRIMWMFGYQCSVERFEKLVKD